MRHNKLTRNFSRPLILAEFIAGPAGVHAKGALLDAGEQEGVPVAPGADDALVFLEGQAVLEPLDLGFGGGVNDTDDLGFVVLPGVDEGLLLLNQGGIWKNINKL